MGGINFKTASTMTFVILICLFIQTSLAQEETQCRGHPINLTEKQKGQITECLDASGIKSFWKIPAEKLPCLGVCILEKKEMLTPDGRIDHAKALAYIEAAMTGPVKKLLIDGIDQCIKDHGDKIKKDGDPKCMTFMDVGQCVHDVFFEVKHEPAIRPRILFAKRGRSSTVGAGLPGRRMPGPSLPRSSSPGMTRRIWNYIAKVFRFNRNNTSKTETDSLRQEFEKALEE